MTIAADVKALRDEARGTRDLWHGCESGPTAHAALRRADALDRAALALLHAAVFRRRLRELAVCRCVVQHRPYCPANPKWTAEPTTAECEAVR